MKRATKPLKKKKRVQTLSSLKKQVWHEFSEYIRLRDCLFTTRTKERGKCVTCGTELPRKQLQAGHFIAGRHNAVLFSEEGTHAQCWTCNIIKKGNVLAYRRAIIDLYGRGYDEVLEKESQKIVKYTKQDFEAIRADLKEKISKLEERRI